MIIILRNLTSGFRKKNAILLLYKRKIIKHAIFRQCFNFKIPFLNLESDSEEEILEGRNGLDDSDLVSEHKYPDTVVTDVSQMLRDLEKTKI